MKIIKLIPINRKIWVVKNNYTCPKNIYVKPDIEYFYEFL